MEINKEPAGTAEENVSGSERTDEKGWLERLRTYKPLRWVVLGMALEILPLSWHVKEKTQELQETETFQELAKEQLEKYASLEEKGKRAKELFGDHIPFELDVEWQIKAGKNAIQTSENLRKTFSWFSDTRPILGEAVEGDAAEPVVEASDLKLSNLDEAEELEIDKVTFKKILNETYPKGWVIGEITSVTQDARNVPMPEKYGLEEGATSAAIFFRGSESRIIFNSKPYPYEMLDILSHELGHANDWEDDNEMTEEERLDLLLAVGDRIDDEDRYRSSYVESIENKDKELERYLKSTEYWAEICGAYFTQSYNLNAKDYALVEACIERQDPGFNIDEARASQAELIYSSTYGK